MSSRLVCCFVAALYLSACATTNGEIDLSNPTTGDLMFRNNDIKDQIAEQELLINGMKSDLRRLNSDMDQQKEQINDSQRILDSAQAKANLSAQELAKFQSELNALEADRVSIERGIAAAEMKLSAFDAEEVNLKEFSKQETYRRSVKRSEIEGLLLEEQSKLTLMTSKTDVLEATLLRVATDFTPAT